MNLYYVVRPTDGLICSTPATYRVAEGVAIYLTAVTGLCHQVWRDGARVAVVTRT